MSQVMRQALFSELYKETKLSNAYFWSLQHFLFFAEKIKNNELFLFFKENSIDGSVFFYLKEKELQNNYKISDKKLIKDILEWKNLLENDYTKHAEEISLKESISSSEDNSLLVESRVFDEDEDLTKNNSNKFSNDKIPEKYIKLKKTAEFFMKNIENTKILPYDPLDFVNDFPLLLGQPSLKKDISLKPYRIEPIKLKEENLTIVLAIVNNDKVIKDFTINSQGSSIGKSPENEICVQNPVVSRKHCKVTLSKNGKNFVIEDVGSLNGTFFKIKSENSLKLQNRDLIEIGSSLIMVQIGERSNDEFIKVILQKKEGEFLSKSNKMMLSFDMRKGDCIIFAKSQESLGKGVNYVVLEDNFVSKVHCKILIDNNWNVFLSDCGSVNGTWLRLSESSEKSSQFVLKHEDIIRLGEIEEGELFKVMDPTQMDSPQRKYFTKK